MQTKKGHQKVSGSVKLEPEVLEEARQICKEKMLILSAYITRAVFKENARQRRIKNDV